MGPEISAAEAAEQPTHGSSSARPIILELHDCTSLTMSIVPMPSAGVLFEVEDAGCGARTPQRRGTDEACGAKHRGMKGSSKPAAQSTLLQGSRPHFTSSTLQQEPRCHSNAKGATTCPVVRLIEPLLIFLMPMVLSNQKHPVCRPIASRGSGT